MTTMAKSDSVRAARERRRATAILFAGVAVTNVFMVCASTVSTLLGARQLGEDWSGVPNAAGVLGTALGSLAISALMLRHGTRVALVTGYLTAVAGAVLAGYGVAIGRISILILGMVLLGIGNGGAQLSRYSAADLHPPSRRSSATALIVWAGTVGALLGPNLMAPLGDLAGTLSLPSEAGSYLLAAACSLVAAAVSVGLPANRARSRPPSGPGQGSPAALFRRPVVRAALVSMAVGQVVMVAVMTMTPLYMTAHGHAFGAVGAAISVHMVGMFVFSPLTGYLADRFGGGFAVLIGVATVLASIILAALLPKGGDPALFVSTFLLGYGWNLMFVGGSGLLTTSLTADERLRVQGGVDAMVWTASAAASVTAGLLLAATSYAALAVISGILTLLPVGFLLGTPLTGCSGVVGEEARPTDHHTHKPDSPSSRSMP